MAYEVVVPRLGLTMEEGRIVEWFKQAGETVEEGERLFAVETDKVVEEVNAAVGGIVHPIPGLPDEPLPIGTPIGYILAPGEALPPLLAAGGVPAASAEVTPAAERPALAAAVTAPGTGRKLSSPAARRRAAELGVDWRLIERPGGGPVLLAHVEAAQARPSPVAVSPVARRLADSAGVDLSALAAQKPGERITRADVEAVITARRKESPVAVPAPAQAPTPALAPTSAAAPAPVPGTLLPLTQVRRVIAERMIAGSQNTAPVTLTTEADATDLVTLRDKFKAALAPQGAAVPSYTDLLIKLTGIALGEHPLLNATWQETGIFVPEEVNIAVAMDTEDGLLVPVIRGVPAKSLQQIATESSALAEKARSHRLTVDDLQGGTFTITNLGTYGIDAFSPIINLPQCAILGVGRILGKPAVVGDQVVPRKMMFLSLTFDHRVVDGGPAARFLNRIREYVEQPYQWLSR